MSYEEISELKRQIKNVRCECNCKYRKAKLRGKIKKINFVRDCELINKIDNLDDYIFVSHDEENYEGNRISYIKDFNVELNGSSLLEVVYRFSYEICDMACGSYISEEERDDELSIFIAGEDSCKSEDWLFNRNNNRISENDNNDDSEDSSENVDITENLKSLTGLYFTDEQFRDLIKSMIRQIDYGSLSEKLFCE